MKNLDRKKTDAVKDSSKVSGKVSSKVSSKEHVSNADILAQILAVPIDEKFAAEMRALRAAAIAGGMKTLNDAQFREYIDCRDDRQEL